MRTVAAFAVAGLISAAAAGCGENDQPANALAWQGQPAEVHPKLLRRDTVLGGQIVNRADREASLEADDIKLIGRGGQRVESSATFAPGYVRSLFPRNVAGNPDLASERKRLGKELELEPGATSTLTVSWRREKGQARPVRIDYGFGSLPIPDR